MPDPSAVRGEQDRVRINMDEEAEVQFWTNELGVDARTLKQVIAQTGNTAKAVREHLQRRLGAR